MRENLNKKICEKRVKEELVETLREWGMAKASYHAECKPVLIVVGARKRESQYVTFSGLKLAKRLLLDGQPKGSSQAPFVWS